ncbi:membrane-associated methyltransferase, putative [Bodo saltans]|uniref:Membrane-associated methyltransferase, putative n=1 Tax=Bodo saltans TaxID=75058 RepID=A0A0S4JBU7_BODSA|nr:membrane-associated methyltransferase, putative [Bodo saltans]|eukprot:CUG86932.1 membrane-associated methyltransferase, putative [Bodo saltans]
MNPKLFFSLILVASSVLIVSIVRPTRATPSILGDEGLSETAVPLLFLAAVGEVEPTPATHRSVPLADQIDNAASTPPIASTSLQTFDSVAQLLNHTFASPRPENVKLTVCVVGSTAVTQKWARLLPSSSTFITFPCTSTNKSRVPHPRFSVFSDKLPVSLWKYFGGSTHRRCGLSIIDVNSTACGVNSFGMPLANSTAKAVGLLRSVSEAPHLVLFSSSHDAAPVHNAALEEVTKRRYVRPDVARILTLGADGDDGTRSSSVYNVRMFSKELPHPSKHLQRLLTSSTWSSVNLRPLNVLAKAIYKTVRTKAAGLLSNVEGNSAQLKVERKVYTALAQLPEVKTICEIGFNMGHSASLWLLANPTANVYMFDLWSHEYSPIAENFLRSSKATAFGLRNVSSRLTITKGSSLTTVPKFAKERPDVKCDILSVDGGHTYELGLQDIENMRQLANPNFNILLVDDTNCDAGWCVDEPCFEHERRGNIVNLLRISEFGGYRGISVFQYNNI